MVGSARLGLVPVTAAAVAVELGVEALLGSAASPWAGTVQARVLGTLGSVAAAGIVFAYAYHLGRRGTDWSGARLVGTFLAVGVAGGLAVTGVRMAVVSPDAFAGRSLPVLAGVGAVWVVDYVVLFSLAGLAGLPLGERTAGDDEGLRLPDSRVAGRAVGVAAGAGGLAIVLSDPSTFLSGVARGDAWFLAFDWAFLRIAVANLLLYGVPFWGAYRLGRRGLAASPARVAIAFGAGGVVAAAVRFTLWSVAVSPPGMQYLAADAVRFTPRFVLVGLAGVPLGRLAALTDGHGVDADDPE